MEPGFLRMQEQNSGPRARHAVDTSAEQLSQPQVVVLDPQMFMHVQGTTNKPANQYLAYNRKVLGILHIFFGVVLLVLVAVLPGLLELLIMGLTGSLNAILAGVSGIIASSNPNRWKTNKPTRKDIVAHNRKVNGIMHIILGVLMIILMAAFYHDAASHDNTVYLVIYALLGFSIVDIAGVSGIVASSDPTKCKSATAMFLSVLCFILMVILFILGVMSAISSTHFVEIIVLVGASLDFVILMSQFRICCKVLCCQQVTPQVGFTQQGHENGGFVFSPSSMQGGIISQSIPMTTSGTTIPIHIDGAAPETGIGSEEICYQDIATYDSLAVTIDDSLPSYNDATNVSSATNASMATTQTDAQPTDTDLTSGEHVYQGLYSEIDMSKL